MKASRSGNIQRFLGRYMSVGGSLTLGLLCSLGALEARAQSQSTNPTLPSTLICYPGFDAKCSPKVFRGSSAISANASITNVVLNMQGTPHTPPAGQLLQNFPRAATGFCGREGQLACPEYVYGGGGLPFKALTASATISARGNSVGLSSDPGQACGKIFADLYKKEGANETRVSSEFLGQSCDALFTTGTFTYTATGLEVGKDYVLKGRLQCYYGAVPANGFFRCQGFPLDFQVVLPFGEYTVQPAN